MIEVAVWLNFQAYNYIYWQRTHMRISNMYITLQYQSTKPVIGGEHMPLTFKLQHRGALLAQTIHMCPSWFAHGAGYHANACSPSHYIYIYIALYMEPARHAIAHAYKTVYLRSHWSYNIHLTSTLVLQHCASIIMLWSIWCSMCTHRATNRSW